MIMIIMVIIIVNKITLTIFAGSFTVIHNNTSGYHKIIGNSSAH